MDFNVWAEACVERTAALVCGGLPTAWRPRVDGAARMRLERFVSFEHRRGHFAVWLHVVPPEHGLGTAIRAATQGAGIVDWSHDVVPRAALREWFSADTAFRWQRLDGGLELCALTVSTRRRDTPETAAGWFAPQVVEGLRQAGFL